MASPATEPAGYWSRSSGPSSFPPAQSHQSLFQSLSFCFVQKNRFTIVLSKQCFHHVLLSSAQIHTAQHSSARLSTNSTTQHSKNRSTQHSTNRHTWHSSRHQRCMYLKGLNEDRLCQPGRAVVGPSIVVGFQCLHMQHDQSAPET